MKHQGKYTAEVVYRDLLTDLQYYKYYVFGMMSVQQIIICLKCTSRNNTIFPKSLYHRPLAMLKLWYHCSICIHVLYAYMYYMYTCTICIHVLYAYMYYMYTCTICIHVLYVCMYYMYTCTICIHVLYVYMYVVCKVLLCNPPNWSCVILQHMICLGTMT